MREEEIMYVSSLAEETANRILTELSVPVSFCNMIKVAEIVQIAMDEFHDQSNQDLEGS
jgi:hypothetical protein